MIHVLSKAKCNCIVGVETYPHAEPEWNVLIAAGHNFDVIAVAMGLHMRGFSMEYGMVEVTPGQMSETFVIKDVLPEALPEAEEVEVDVQFDHATQDGLWYFTDAETGPGGRPGMRFRPVDPETPFDPKQARTEGTEGIWEPERGGK